MTITINVMAFGPAITAVALIALIALRLSGHHMLPGVAKMIASTGFLFTAYSAGAFERGAFGAIIFSGLVFGWFGDLFLIPENSKKIFLAGLVSFLLGHLAYAVAFIIHGPGYALAAAAFAPLALAGWLLFRWLDVERGNPLRLGVAAYISVITLMTALGIGMWGREAWIYLAAGSVLFYGSDIGVALDRFKPRRIPAYVWSLPMYYGGQTCFALSLAFISKNT